jgi:hypothetical protein
MCLGRFSLFRGLDMTMTSTNFRAEWSRGYSCSRPTRGSPRVPNRSGRVHPPRSHHESFRDRGIAAVGLTEEYVGGDTSPHNHRATDTAATVNLDYLELAARLAGQVIVTAVAVP